MTALRDLRRRDAPAALPAKVLARGRRTTFPSTRDLVAVAVVAGVLGAHCVVLIGEFVTGNDPGNWLASGREMWTQPAGLPGFARPLVPTLVALLAVPFGPLEALRAVAVASLLAVALAVFLVLRKAASMPVALAAALFVGFSRPLAETVAFGGYPQNVALAGCIVAAGLTSCYLRQPSAGVGRALAAVLVVTALAHHIYFVLAVMGGAAVTGRMLLVARERHEVLQRARGLLPPLVAAVIAFLPTAVAFTTRGYEATPGIHPMGREAALSYMFGDAGPLYVAVFLLGGGYALATMPRRQPSAALQAGAALLAVAGAAFVASGEPRLLAMLLIGAVICAALLLDELRHAVPAGPSRWVLRAAPLAAVLLFVPSAIDTNHEVFAYYRVLDRDLVTAVEFVDGDQFPGAVAVVKGRDGWPTGWWFEGLGHREVVVGSDPGWLGFPAERRDAALVDALTAPVLTSHEARTLADSSGVTLLVADHGAWLEWKQWLTEREPAVELAYANGRYVVLRFVPPRSEP